MPSTAPQPLLTPEANRPFLFSGGPVGCLLVHGFTGTPNEMRGLGRYLADEGHTVLGVRLFAHSLDPRDMMRAVWRDWAASVEDGYWMLREAGREVVVLGLSMGGVLALELASRLPVAGVVAMSTPASLPKDWRVNFTRQLSLIMPYVDKGPSDWVDPAVEATHVDYPRYPVRAIGELRGLLAELQRALPQVQAPTLVIHSRTDGGVAPENAEAVFAALGAAQRELLWIERSGHVVTEDIDHMHVWRASADWVHRVTRSQGT
jgi:carboxylesterase